MKVTKYLPTSSTEELKKALVLLESDSSVKSVLLFIADNQEVKYDHLNEVLHSLSKPIIGGVFPELIFNNDRKQFGMLLIGLSFKMKTLLVPIHDDLDSLSLKLQIFNQKLSFESNSLFLFVDAFSNNKSRTIEEIYNFYGITLSYLGGGAGSLNLKSKPCVLTNDGILSNAFALAVTDKQLRPGVAHGWKPISEPIKVSKSEGNIIKSLNWQPAFKLYKEIVENHSGKSFDHLPFFELAKSYPLGISKLQAELVVRDPLMLQNETELVIVDDVPEGEFVHVLHGNMDYLLEGAQTASKQAWINRDKDKDLNIIFCIDCISRVLYMNEDFQKEINMLSKELPVHGILSIGEIANTGESFLEMFNKTVVVTAV